MTETGVVHGRFQILHNDHLKYLMAGKSKCRHLIVGITNPDPTLSRKDAADPARSSSHANPFTYYERYQMVKTTLLGQGLGITGNYSLSPLTANSLFQVSKHNPLGIRILVQSARG